MRGSAVGGWSDRYSGGAIASVVIQIQPSSTEESGGGGSKASGWLQKSQAIAAAQTASLDIVVIDGDNNVP